MAEEKKEVQEQAEGEGLQEAEQQEQPTVEELQAEVERWKGYSRSWEDRAKNNAKSAEELEALKALQAEQQAELDALKAEKERLNAIQRVSEETGVPAKLLNFCADEQAMREFAGMFDQTQPTVHSAPAARSSNVVRNGEQAPTTADAFADYMEGLLH